MKESRIPVNTIDEYIQTWPEEIQVKLKAMRDTIGKAAPKASEKISYGMPTFVLNGHLVYFAAFKKHIGFFAVPSGIKAFKKELTPYKMGKGSVQFPYNEQLPLSLVTKIVKFRVKENEAKAVLKKKKPK